MNVIKTRLPDVLLIEPDVFADERGFFMESFNARKFEQAVGRRVSFVQDNHSRSQANVLRGLHYQIQQPQAKLVRVVLGRIFDVVVDLRRASPTFGQWVAEELSAENKRQVWVPEGFAHGFLVLSEEAEVEYKTSTYYAPEHERCITWNDLDLAISWPLKGAPVLSVKDEKGVGFREAEVFE
ncbi:dTDP-4-dehydrorhamnose 3,5-epimerase [Advenella sp. WQ 585]|uniref:dTDP-4-dehydrorhamnose 3,5-epimerase n=1 Tax=Advenella mandrilli TaxID=2800330 RepID=A0ABS1EG33_9BURK|nr:dTDP-4-dehydrorhamnose 3,5-epimerase [Advenella mandrilli]MBK1781285.1 dTDP-4-dehydrorhamnose 3,5-epimerase [Advenella mandrilli]